MYRGLCFSRATFWVCGSAFLLFGLLYEWAGWWERTNVEASALVIATCDLKLENARLRREQEVLAPFYVEASDEAREMLAEHFAKTLDMTNRAAAMAEQTAKERRRRLAK